MLTRIATLWKRVEQWLKQFRLVDEGFTFAAEMGKRSIPTNAAGISFYFFISIVPFSILLCSQLPYTGISSDALIEAVTRLTPDAVDALVASIITEAYTSRIALFSVSLLVLMWSSAKVVTAMIRALDAIYGQEDRRNYFVITGNALLYTAVLLLGSGGVLFLSTKGKSAEEFLLRLLPVTDAYQTLATHGHRLLGCVLFVLFFALVYTVFPAGKRNYVYQLPGAVLAEIGVLIFSLFYAVYNQRGNVYHSFYGSLANLALFLMWLYTCVMLFLFGGVFNARYQDRFRTLLRKDEKK